jgi:hypothetical protein
MRFNLSPLKGQTIHIDKVEAASHVGGYFVKYKTPTGIKTAFVEKTHNRMDAVMQFYSEARRAGVNIRDET